MVLDKLRAIDNFYSLGGGGGGGTVLLMSLSN